MAKAISKIVKKMSNKAPDCPAKQLFGDYNFIFCRTCSKNKIAKVLRKFPKCPKGRAIAKSRNLKRSF